jgi:hypothetical protein
MPGPLAERLENLSGYQPVYAAHDPSAALNPINFSHVRLNLGGRLLSVLSRVGPAALDYSGRVNKYAHHVVLDPDERPLGGPAWLLSQPGFVQTAWEGEPRMLAEGRIPPQGDRAPGVAQSWQGVTGDSGWAGVLAEAFLTDPRRPVFLIYRPGMDVLPLFVEAIALLPTPKRWEVEFGTYLSQVPQGISYSWRGVLDGSPEAHSAMRLPHALTVNLCSPSGSARGGVLVHLARTGEQRSLPETRAVAPISSTPLREPTPTAIPMIPTAGPPPRSAPPISPANYDLIPDLAARLAALEPYSEGNEHPRHHINRKGIWAAGILTALMLTTGAVLFVVKNDSESRRLGLKSTVTAESSLRTQEDKENAISTTAEASTSEPAQVHSELKPPDLPQVEAGNGRKEEQRHPSPPMPDPKPLTPPVAKVKKSPPLPPKRRSPSVTFLTLPRVGGEETAVEGSKQGDGRSNRASAH